jgi:phage protein D/phage baseplate assembly protein gpV
MASINGFDVGTTGQLMPPVPQSTFLNTTNVKVKGTVIPSIFVVSSIRVYCAVNKVPFALLTLHDGSPATQSFPISNSNTFTPGNEIEILSGYHSEEKTIFKGIIIRHGVKIRQGAPPMLEIECKHEAIKMTVDRKNKYFYNQNDSSIIDEILRSSKVKGEGGSMNVMHKEMIQFFATDWDFMAMRAEANGNLVIAKNDGVKIIKPDFEQEAKFNLNYGTSIFEYEAEMDARDQYPSAKAVTWNPSDQNESVSEESEQGAIGGGGFLGGAVAALQSAGNALEDVASQAGINVEISGTPPETDFKAKLGVAHLLLQHSGYVSSEELQSWSKAQYTKSRLAKLRGRVRFQGVADINPGDLITIKGVGLRHEGKVFVAGVLHEISGGAWFTQVQFGLAQKWFAQEYNDVAALPASALLPPVHGLQIGVVTALENDPESQQRIQVRLPLVDMRGEGLWMRLAAQDAGNNRGAVWRPEIGDEVIVGFLNDDPRDGVVLGSLHSSAKPMPINAADVNHEKGWVTRSGMRLIFNDEKKSIEISTPAGKKIILDEDPNKIEILDEHSNKITMNAEGVTVEAAKELKLKAGTKIKMEAPQIEAKADGTFKMEATGQFQISTTGDMVVKGSFVRIN